MAQSARQHKSIGVNGVSIATYQQVDPSHTLTLRNAFASDMGKRFRELRGIIWRAIVDEDVFGLMTGSTTTTLPLTLFSLDRGLKTYQMRTPGPRAFAFNTSRQKVSAFMEWLNEQVEQGILEASTIPQLGQGIQPQWTDVYIQSAYQQGIRKGHQELIKAGWDIPSIEKLGGIEAIFNQPFHADRVGLLFTRTFSDLRGITGTMETQIARVLAQAMADGKGPREIARLLNRTISGPMGDLGITDTLGRFIPAERRAKILARTEIIRAHAEAQLQEFENWGVVGVTAEVEFRTAGDSRVCVICASLNEKIFTIEEARGVIPRHPQCRCIWLPVDPEADETD
jgi:SPP1 gp7 family putative phage head morphogenesis protein